MRRQHGIGWQTARPIGHRREQIQPVGIHDQRRSRAIGYLAQSVKQCAGKRPGVAQPRPDQQSAVIAQRGQQQIGRRYAQCVGIGHQRIGRFGELPGQRRAQPLRHGQCDQPNPGAKSTARGQRRRAPIANAARGDERRAEGAFVAVGRASGHQPPRQRCRRQFDRHIPHDRQLQIDADVGHNQLPASGRAGELEVPALRPGKGHRQIGGDGQRI